MHIEPGVVSGAKMGLSLATAGASFGVLLKSSWTAIKSQGLISLILRSLISAVLVFCFFEVLPKHPIGVSEVHFILGSTLFLLFGPAAAGVGLTAGLLLQGMFFAPTDLPMYFVNITTLLAPLMLVSIIAKKIIPANTAYKDVTYKQALALSTAYQGGIVAWVAFWALYGQGFGAENMASIGSFGAAYMIVIVFEPLVDLGVLAGAKALHQMKDSPLFHDRLYNNAA
ncbi:energy-coupling factor ABC transporter permease [Sneathiella glossodoripedis]|uniref:energy-coupling factor ABC transporter permease n=1 Tax=Sneathiella glossodoripedis TaxID=418853 RepID=UPI0004700D0B|nr:energy-coupling factor ABC transporter permease [Sneathiella glossodoripedis]